MNRDATHFDEADELLLDEAVGLAHGLAEAMYQQALDALRSSDRHDMLLSDGPRASKKFGVHAVELHWVNGGRSRFPFRLVAELAGVTETELRRLFVRKLPQTKYRAFGPRALIIKRK